MVERLGFCVVKAVSPLLWEDLRLTVVQVLENSARVSHRCGREACLLASNNARIELEAGRKCHPIPSRRDDTSVLSIFALSGAPCPWVVFVNGGVLVWLLGDTEGSAGSLYTAVAATESSCG